MSNKRIAIVLAVFFTVLSIIFFIVVIPMIQKSLADTPALPIILADQNHHIQPFSFQNQDGQTITEQDIKGKVCICEYFFATCMGMCPKMNNNMQAIYEQFKNDDRVLIMSHTVDPNKDSVAALKLYSGRYKADSKHWMFLTGDKKQLYDMARYSYLIIAKQDTAGVSIDKDFIHDNHFVLIDGLSRVRGFYDGLDPKDVARMIGDIKILLAEKRPQ